MGDELLKELLVLLINWLPWLFGIGLVYGLLFRSGEWKLSQHMIAIGCGAFAGYMTTAIMMYELQAKNLPVFSAWLIAWALLLLVVFFLLGQLSSAYSSKMNPANPKSVELFVDMPTFNNRWELACFTFLTLWLVSVVAFVTFETALRPATAWDTIWYWSFYAGGFLDWQLIADPSVGSIPLGPRHPFAVVLINAWGSFSTQLAGNDSFLFAPWLAIYLGSIMILCGIVATLQRSPVTWPIAGLLASTAPLIEGHTALGGYSDYWLAAGFLCSLGILSLTNSKRLSLPHLALWFFVVASLSTIKSAGITYSLLLTTALGISLILRKPKSIFLLLGLIFFMAVGVYLILMGFDFNLLGTHLSYQADSGQLRINQYRGQLEWKDWGSLLNNLGTAWIFNSSYLLILALLICSTPRLFSKKQSSLVSTYAISGTIFLTIHIIIAQQVSDHFFHYAMPGRDTGLSRFSQIWYVSVLTFAISSWKSAR